MKLTVLSVAYPLAPVSPDSVGGAEQILAAIDRALVEAGHRSLVVALAGSRVAGDLIATQPVTGPYDDAAIETARSRTRTGIAQALAERPIDLVHLHGVDFPAYLPSTGAPVLATLHLPPSWYPAEALRPARPNVWFNPVSLSQALDCPTGPHILPPIPNGVALEALEAGYAKRDFALVLGRICPEKGIHLAIDAAQAAGTPLVIAGEVFPYEGHRRYFEAAIRPRLGRRCRFVGPIGLRAKRRLLTAARCLLIPALAPETSSLVAREAAACGTPVIAFRAGALPEAVQDGVTGWLVDDEVAMAGAIARAHSIAPEACRRLARERFSDRAMTAAYLELYASLVAGRLGAEGGANGNPAAGSIGLLGAA